MAKDTYFVHTLSLLDSLPKQVPFALPAFTISVESETKSWNAHTDDFHSLPTRALQEPQPETRSVWSDTRFRSVTHPNSPYVPWSEHQRQHILASAVTLRGDDGYSYDKSKEWVKVSCNDTLPPPVSSRGTLRRRILAPITRCLRLLCSPVRDAPPLSMTGPSPRDLYNDSTTSISSVQTTSLEDWLAERRMETLAKDIIPHPKAYISLDEYEQNGSWIAGHGPCFASPALSLDCIPSPSPTVISLPYILT